MMRLIIIAMVVNVAVLWTIAEAETIVLQPGSEGKDTYVCDCLPNTNNPNGPVSHLYQGSYGACYDRMLIEWDISSIPEEMVITDATMELLTFSNLYGSVQGQMTYSLITSHWEETSVTYNTEPDTSHAIYQVVENWPLTSGELLAVDIAEFVQAWYAGSYENYGLYGVCQNTSSTCCAGFHSSDATTASTRPKLTINYYDPNAVRQLPDVDPVEYQLAQNFPNPVNPQTTLQFSIPKEAHTNLTVFNMYGQEIANLIDRTMPAGVYQTDFDGSGMVSGVYIYHLQSGNFRSSGKMLLVK
ncbi:DNRLRE domain-containing protein [bacterium]|nr:DNRLRE domain-containing protein [bacterium]MBU1652425.1 DNRLRE domain-containing protein [bacterium]